MLLTILSGLFGGLLRLAPELLKFFDAKNDRQHELDMQDKALAFQQVTGTQKIAEIHAQGEADAQKAQIDALQTAFTTQAAMASAGGKLISFISALVRPAVTFFVFLMWAAWKISVMVYAWELTGNMVQVLMNNWGQDDTSMLTMIVSFWFVGRSIEKQQ
jgi:hypothetical protein